MTREPTRQDPTERHEQHNTEAETMKAEQTILAAAGEELAARIEASGGIHKVLNSPPGSGLQADLYGEARGLWKIEVYHGINNDDSTRLLTVSLTEDEALELW